MVRPPHQNNSSVIWDVIKKQLTFHELFFFVLTVASSFVNVRNFGDQKIPSERFLAL